MCLFQIFGLEFLLGSDTLWPVLLALTILPAVLQSVMLPFCPESPRYLLIVLNQEEEARKGEFPMLPSLGFNETYYLMSHDFLTMCGLKHVQ